MIAKKMQMSPPVVNQNRIAISPGNLSCPGNWRILRSKLFNIFFMQTGDPAGISDLTSLPTLRFMFTWLALRRATSFWSWRWRRPTMRRARERLSTRHFICCIFSSFFSSTTLLVADLEITRGSTPSTSSSSSSFNVHFLKSITRKGSPSAFAKFTEGFPSAQLQADHLGNNFATFRSHSWGSTISNHTRHFVC